MYHALLAQPAPGTSPVHIAAQLFEQQMAWLHAQGYEAITVTDMHRQLTTSQLNQKNIAITFDDGYRSLVARAAPALKKYGFTATLFLATGFVGLPKFIGAFANAVPPDDRPLTWAEVRELQAAGWDIQAHSRTHRLHAALPAAELRSELTESKQLIAEQLDSSVQFYAFPYGNYNRHVLQALVNAGYQAGFSVHSGLANTAHDLRRLPRIEMNTGCDLHIFAKLVRTGYPSAAAAYRARLRDALFYFPGIKDVLQSIFKRFIN
ncbi:polysaccharide deacetylase family protein [Hymenobacter terricola]|uniref:polysaccharide deacetylase family protein n=1 Tax=Hymenobacter terricola TaxID=2819236 RepID=UPI001B3003A4|nr:polysaccharide deacetylase family protein [Hymenobacter terricola]